MKVKSVLVVASILLFAILFNSCEDSTVNVSGTATVLGTVRGLMNLSLDNVKITIKDKSVYTSADGKFSLSGVSMPCDIYVKDSTRKYEIIYKNVNTSSLVLNLPVWYNLNLLANYNLIVHYPTLPPEQQGRLLFMDDEKDIVGLGDIPGSNITFQAQPNLSFKGKVFLITYTKDVNQHINDYKYFATKSDVTITSGNPTEMTFTQSDLLNVEEDNLSFVLNPPQGSSSVFSAYVLNFFNRRMSGFINFLALETYSTNNVSLLMPKNLPVEFTPTLFLSSAGTNGNVNQMNIIPKTGTNVQINLASSPTVLSPNENATNVDLNTVFSFQKQSSSNVLVFSISDTVSGIRYNFCTSENNITLSMLSPMLTSLAPNSRYNYSIEQVGVGSNNVGEFLRDGNMIPYIQAGTPLRRFTSKP
ncbi:MAG: hypothetical protein ACOYN6_07805 [Ignavibacteria bacterium]